MHECYIPFEALFDQLKGIVSKILLLFFFFFQAGFVGTSFAFLVLFSGGMRC